MKILAVLCLLVLTTSAAVLKPRKQPTKQCKAFHPETFDWHIIFPGTKWCGDGDIADNFDDLGRFVETDKCCRAHDYCDDIIPAGGSNHGLNNDGKFTRLNCKCDLAFFDCLGESSCTSAKIVATTYFNIMGEKCFDLKYPATCVEYDDIIGLRPRCVQYEYDETKPKEWQWFDVPRWLFGHQCDLVV